MGIVEVILHIEGVLEMRVFRLRRGARYSSGLSFAAVEAGRMKGEQNPRAQLQTKHYIKRHNIEFCSEIRTSYQVLSR
jgi:hypothetical protein